MTPDEEFAFVWNMIYYPLVVIMFFLNCFADARPRYIEGVGKSDVTFDWLFIASNDYIYFYSTTKKKIQNPSPEESASFLSVITNSWFEPLIWRGYRKPLEATDLWDLNRRDKSSYIVPRYDRHWENSLKNAAKKYSRYYFINDSRNNYFTNIYKIIKEK